MLNEHPMQVLHALIMLASALFVMGGALTKVLYEIYLEKKLGGQS